MKTKFKINYIKFHNQNIVKNHSQIFQIYYLFVKIFIKMNAKGNIFQVNNSSLKEI